MARCAKTVPTPPWPSRGSCALAVCCWAYLATMLGVWLTLQRAEVWWPATVLMFSPRWVFALPLGVLLPAAVFLRRRSVLVLFMAGAIAIWPVAGFNVPWPRLTDTTLAGPPFRVLTICTTARATQFDSKS